MASSNNRDKCEKCGKISQYYHYIYDENLKRTDRVSTSRKAGEGELVFCTKEHCNEYVAPCYKCQKYRKGQNWHKTDKKDGKYFCSEKCLNDYCAPTCDYCHKGKGYWHDEKENDGKFFCSKSCLNIYYAPLCDICQKKCLKYQRKWSNSNQKSNDWRPVDSLWYYNDLENKTGKICSDCNKKKSEFSCTQCGVTKSSGGYTHKEKNDGKVLCSDNCFGIYYGYYVEKCQDCSKKLFKSYQNYCSSCERKHEQEIRKQEIEQKRKEKELKNNFTGSESSNDNSQDLLNFPNEQKNNGDKNDSIEREREREQKSLPNRSKIISFYNLPLFLNLFYCIGNQLHHFFQPRPIS